MQSYSVFVNVAARNVASRYEAGSPFVSRSGIAERIAWFRIAQEGSVGVVNASTGMANRLDEIDKRVLYHLAADARDTSAPAIAEEVNVSAGTIRNRIRQLEADGTIKG